MTHQAQLRAIIRRDKRNLRELAEALGVHYVSLRRFAADSGPAVFSEAALDEIAHKLGYVARKSYKRNK